MSKITAYAAMTAPASNDVTVAVDVDDTSMAASGTDKATTLAQIASIAGTAIQYAAPAVVVLTDAATIAVDASQGNHFRVTLGGNRTLGNPSNPTDGEKVVFEVIQDSTGSRTLAYGTAYHFGAASTPVLTTTLNKRDLLGFIYSASASAWLFTGIVQGF